MEIKEKDFVKVDYDLYANGELVHTTSEAVAKKHNFTAQKQFGAESMILGKSFVLKALDDAIIASKGAKNKIELTEDKAYGKRSKENIRTFTKTVFDEQKMRAVPGMVYDFNGMFGTVRSVVGGRVLIDFNHPLSGKTIVIEYVVSKKIEEITEKIALVMDTVLRVPKQMYSVEKKEKVVTVKVPEQFMPVKEMLVKSFGELIPEVKDYTLNIEGKKVEAPKKAN